MQERFEARLVRVSMNEVASGLRYAYLVANVALISIFCLQLLSDALLERLAIGFLPCSFLMALLFQLAKRPRRTAVDVQIDNRGISVDGRLVMPRKKIRSGATHTTAEGETRVVFELHRSLGHFFGRP